MCITQEERYVRKVTRDAICKAGGPLDLSIEIDASDKSIYKWASGSSKPDALHFLRMLKFLELID